MIGGKKKLGGIEFFRFYFVIQVCLCHIWTAFPKPHTDFSVEFFFVLSGIFLYRSYLKNFSLRDFAKRRFSRLYPTYVCTTVLGFLLGLFILYRQHVQVPAWDALLQFIPESLMLQGWGMFPASIINANPVIWYTSVMWLSGLFLYPLLLLGKEYATKVILPLLIFVIYSYIFSVKGLQLKDLYGYAFREGVVVSLPLLRGIADMSLGILLSAVHNSCAEPFGKKMDFAVNIVSVFSFLLLLWCCYSPYIHNEPVMLICLVGLCWGLLMEKSWFNIIFSGKLFISLGRLSYGIYLFHVYARYLINYVYDRTGGTAGTRPLYIVVYLLISIALAWIYEKLRDEGYKI